MSSWNLLSSFPWLSFLKRLPPGAASIRIVSFHRSVTTQMEKEGDKQFYEISDDIQTGTFNSSERSDKAESEAAQPHIVAAPRRIINQMVGTHRWLTCTARPKQSPKPKVGIIRRVSAQNTTSFTSIQYNKLSPQFSILSLTKPEKRQPVEHVRWRLFCRKGPFFGLSSGTRPIIVLSMRGS